MTRRDQRNSFADENWNHADDELIDLAFIQERSNEATATHHPNVLAFLCTQTLGEFFDRLFHEFKTAEDFLWRLARERIVLNTSPHIRAGFAFFLKFQNQLVRFAPPQDRVDRFPEVAHAVIVLGTRALQPIDAAVLARDETIGADGDRNDDFSLLCSHETIRFASPTT